VLSALAVAPLADVDLALRPRLLPLHTLLFDAALGVADVCVPHSSTSYVSCFMCLLLK
jgi:hypothetical protein